MLVNVGKLMSHTSTKGGGGVKHPFNPSLVDAWFMSGLSNSDKPTQIVGVKKNKLQLKNFAYSLSSGFGKYEVDFINLFTPHPSNKDYIVYTSEKIEIIENLNAIFINLNMKKEIPSYKVQVFGITNPYSLRYQYFDKDGNYFLFNLPNDGIYTIPKSYLADDNRGIGFIVSDYKNSKGITITQLPSAYEGALVFDGVDDYALCNNLPILTDYTVICRRSIITVKNSSATASKRSYPDDVGNFGAFVFERTFAAGNKSTYSFGAANGVDAFDENEIVYQTKTSYNGKAINSGSSNDSEYLCLGANAYNINLDKCQEFSNIAVYYFALYDKSLTPEEIEEEKVKLENYWEGGKNELA
jgi:hypothetical protein